MDEKLFKKLRLEKYKNIVLLRNSREENPFDNYISEIKGDTDLVIAYTYSLEEMKDVIQLLCKNEFIKDGACVYFAYPKQKNKLGHKPIARDDIFPFLNVDEETGFVKDTDFKFNMMVALDENYTLIAVKKILEKKISNKPSQCVDDYVEFIPKIEEFLKEHKKESEFYKSLTFGYKKDWARYVFSAKTEGTRKKRVDEMVEILSFGIKSKDLYRAFLKKEGK